MSKMKGQSLVIFLDSVFSALLYALERSPSNHLVSDDSFPHDFNVCLQNVDWLVTEGSDEQTGVDLCFTARSTL